MVQLFYRLIKIDILDYKSILNYHPITLTRTIRHFMLIIYIYIYTKLLDHNSFVFSDWQTFSCI